MLVDFTPFNKNIIVIKMLSKAKLNKYARLKRKVHVLLCDLDFLRACNRLNISPNFVKISAAVKNSRSEVAIKKASKTWLKAEIKHAYKDLADTELELLSLHLELTKNLNSIEHSEWCEYDAMVHRNVSIVVKKKKATLSRKLNKLIDSVPKKPQFTPELIPDFICNESDVVFSDEELEILNKGLKFAPKPNKLPLLDTVVDIETCLKFKLPSIQHDIRNNAAKVIDSIKANTKKSELANKQKKIIDDLRMKEVVYMKADKGNKLVILNKFDYDFRVTELIKKCKYECVKKDPLPKMVRESDKIRKRIGTVFSSRLQRMLIVSNPKLAKLYALPKIHKPGKEMRPIVSNIDTPCYNLAKWLVREMKQLQPLDSLSVKNSFEFVEKTKDIIIEPNEIMVSFDVCSLFPSIPVDIALIELKKHLDKCGVPVDKKTIYCDVAKLCMEQSYFQFRGDIFKVTHGTNMGNPLSPLISELFMSAFEMSLKELKLLPRVWYRYVDDVFAIVKRDEVDSILENLNKQFDSIKFTCEKEQDNILPFLDLEIQRKGQIIEFAIYHKPTSTMRTITSDSHSPIQHKKAAYHSMVHRLCRLPLSVNNYMREYKYIKNVARVNGYGETMIDELILKHSRRSKRFDLSTLFSQIESEQNQRVALSFAPNLTNKLKKKFKEHSLDIVYRNNNKLCNLLDSTKDKTTDLKKSGIYAVKCNDCDDEYIGQTKRSIEKRFSDHLTCIRLNRPVCSAVAAHALKNNHRIDKDTGVRLVKAVMREQQLDAYESFFIQRNMNSMNLDNGNIFSCLFSRI